MNTNGRKECLNKEAANKVCEAVSEAMEILPARNFEILLRRDEGETLVSIGNSLNLTRERIRQIEAKSKKTVRTSLKYTKGWQTNWDLLTDGVLEINVNDIASSYPISQSLLVGLRVALEVNNWKPIRAIEAWRCRDIENSRKRLKSLIYNEPVPEDEFYEEAFRLGFARHFINDAINSEELPVEIINGYAINSKRKRKQRIFAYLLEHGPSPSKRIAKNVGEKTHRNIDAFMARQSDFQKMYPQGTWALASEVEVSYKSALPALLDLLENEGPLAENKIYEKMSEIYPVSKWRIRQCLDNYQIGQMDDDRYWLIERGAKRRQESEPSKPDFMEASGDVIGIRKKVDKDMLRGSGMMDNIWLGWKLGLQYSPASISFTNTKGFEDFSVTRTGTNVSLSSIKSALDKLDLRKNCEIILILNTKDRTWDIHHACQEGHCFRSRN